MTMKRYLNISPDYIGVYYTESKAIAAGNNDDARESVAVPFEGTDDEMRTRYPNREIEVYETPLAYEFT